MAKYIWSDANRFYAATESQYGAPVAVQPSNRFQATRLKCHQSQRTSKRRDKTGARTYLGGAPTAPLISAFEVDLPLSSWDQATVPSYGPFVQAAMGGVPDLVQGLVVAAFNSLQIQTQLPHNLVVGSAIASGKDVRFVTAVGDQLNLTINVPFLSTPTVGGTLGTTVGYQLAPELPSLCLYDYWDPVGGVSRLLTGAGVDTFQISVKGDVHELTFAGPAADILDSRSGSFGVSGLQSFPAEPPLSTFDYSIVPGQLGEVWLGSPLNQVFTLTEASIAIKNNIAVRAREFGSSYPMAQVPGPREVLISFTLFAQSDTSTTDLYVAAKTRAPISAMLQLGQQGGQMMAVYLPKVVPSLPLYHDSEPYLLWEFKNDLAQGVANDEAYIAFA
jgi:hypothetical protein